MIRRVQKFIKSKAFSSSSVANINYPLPNPSKKIQLHLPLPLCLSVSVSLELSLSLSLCVSVSLALRLSASLALCLWLEASLARCLSGSLAVQFGGPLVNRRSEQVLERQSVRVQPSSALLRGNCPEKISWERSESISPDGEANNQTIKQNRKPRTGLHRWKLEDMPKIWQLQSRHEVLFSPRLYRESVHPEEETSVQALHSCKQMYTTVLT